MSLLIFISVLCLLLSLFSLFFELNVFKKAPFLENTLDSSPIDTSLTLIIPTYNEEINIINCLRALSKIKKPSIKFNILVVDDCSNDRTINEAKYCKKKFFNDSEELNIISAGLRPKDKNWVGKNWACFQGAKETKSEWILFIDADVVLGENCLLNALSKAHSENVDLLSLAPKVNCNCLAEWIVQPIMTSLLIIGFPIFNTNDQSNKTSFAAGPFMLFRNKSYKEIGGHEGTFNEIVEDLSLAKKVKSNNMKLNFLIAIKDISINMYPNFRSLIEGWSKNWFLGLEKDIFKSLSASVFVLFTSTLPWCLTFSGVFISLTYENKRFNSILIIAFLTLLTYAIKRYWLRQEYDIPSNYWYLNGLGGLIVIYIGFISVYKTYTGKGWTWKGRDLVQ